MAGVSGVNFALTGKKANKFLARNLYVTNKTNDMPYPEFMVAPMRRELTDLGFEELKTPEDVQSFVNRKDDLALVVVNSVCGCAASNARPGVRKALEHPQAPAPKSPFSQEWKRMPWTKCEPISCPIPRPLPVLLFSKGVNCCISSSATVSKARAQTRSLHAYPPCSRRSLNRPLSPPVSKAMEAYCLIWRGDRISR